MLETRFLDTDRERGKLRESKRGRLLHHYTRACGSVRLLNKAMESSVWVLLSGAFLFRGCIPHDRLQFEELFKPGLSPFSAVARLFEASKTASEVDRAPLM